MLSEREGGEGGGSRAPPLPGSLTHGPSAHSVTDTFLGSVCGRRPRRPADRIFPIS